MTAAQSDTAANPGAPRYLAAIPWIGPLVGAEIGERNGAAARVPLAGAADPALGPALVAAFVPVVADAARDRYAPADPSGAPAGVLDVGWLQDLRSGDDHWFGIETEAHRLRGEFAGVLMILLYDQSPPGAAAIAARGSARLAFPIAELPAAARDAIVRQLEELLAQEPLKLLRPALIEVPPGKASPPEITFALASCQFPWGMLDRTVGEASYRRLGSRLDAAGPKPECLLLVGDQVYVDATAGLFDPSTRFDRFVAPHEKLFRSHALQDVLRRLPAYMLPDDHEIDDNWEPTASGAGSDFYLDEGRSAYLAFQRRAGPPQLAPEGDSGRPLYFEFARRGFAFFMADTRTEREARSAATLGRARIMSRTQFDRLLGWLDKQDPDLPKFIATPSLLLPRHRRAVQNGHPSSALRSDSWDGYPHSLHRLLAHIADQRIKNVIFLSGDEQRI